MRSFEVPEQQKVCLGILCSLNPLLFLPETSWKKRDKRTIHYVWRDRKRNTEGICLYQAQQRREWTWEKSVTNLTLSVIAPGVLKVQKQFFRILFYFTKLGCQGEWIMRFGQSDDELLIWNHVHHLKEPLRALNRRERRPTKKKSGTWENWWPSGSHIDCDSSSLIPRVTEKTQAIIISPNKHFNI
jgi:hypothetical protein